MYMLLYITLLLERHVLVIAFKPDYGNFVQCQIPCDNHAQPYQLHACDLAATYRALNDAHSNRSAVVVNCEIFCCLQSNFSI